MAAQRFNLEPPERGQSAAARDHARRLFGRTLAGWVSDVLELRRTGVLRPHWEGSTEQTGSPRRRAA